MTIAIIGGGIAGLTAALCLHARGLDATIYERAPAFEEIGAGLQLGPNAVKVLRALGLEDALIAAADRPSALGIRSGYSDAQMLSLPLGASAEARWGAPYLHIHRADLIALLEGAVRAKGIACRLGAELVAIERSASGCELQFADGSSQSADLVIGADGLRSHVRSCLFGPQEPHFTRSKAWRAAVPMQALGRHTIPSGASVWTGRGCHGVTYGLRGGTLANFVGVVDTAAKVEQSWNHTGSAAQALAQFRGFRPALLKLIRAAGTLHQWGIYESAPLPAWSNGRAVLIGDAGHAMPPFLAQGAAMAIEDAMCLSLALSEEVGHAEAFKRFQTTRQPRVDKVLRASRSNKDRFHMKSAPMRIGAFGALRAADVLLKAKLLEQFDWLYGYDAAKS